MACTILKQIAEYVNQDDDSIECVTDSCNSTLTFDYASLPLQVDYYTCDGCSAIHVKDDEGLRLYAEI